MSPSKSSLTKEELINVSAINQYLYCPRRYWYIYFYDTIGENYQFKEGVTQHKNKAKKGGWTEEIYLESAEIGLKGKIDIVEDEDLVPVERKRGGRYFDNDVMQLAGYCYLLEKCTGERVESGVIYLHETDRRVRIPFDEGKKEEIEDLISEIKRVTPDDPPPFVDNRNKCVKCSCRGYCMPEESKMLGETQ